MSGEVAFSPLLKMAVRLPIQLGCRVTTACCCIRQHRWRSLSKTPHTCSYVQGKPLSKAATSRHDQHLSTHPGTLFALA